MRIKKKQKAEIGFLFTSRFYRKQFPSFRAPSRDNALASWGTHAHHEAMRLCSLSLFWLVCSFCCHIHLLVSDTIAQYVKKGNARHEAGVLKPNTLA
jgi:hypothetical protein